jgi:hypothetical protein
VIRIHFDTRATLRLPLAVLLLLAAFPGGLTAAWKFSDVSEKAGAAWMHGFATDEEPGPKMMSGGVASGDYDRDGDVDLYLVTGDITPNVLLINNGDGSFGEGAGEAGLGLAGHVSSGPAFADIDADGWLDLVVGGVAGSGYRVFINLRDGRFEEATSRSGIITQRSRQNDYSSGFGDPDGDGDLDLFVAHWGADAPTNHFWMNQGDGVFFAADAWAGIDIYGESDWSFSPIFTDINGDFSQDLLIASDYGNSEVFQCSPGPRFIRSTTEVIDDENGMGSAAADFDNDGDIDWFVTSVWEEDETPTWGDSGNRLYENDGLGNFTNVTDEAGVAVGHWGWSACAADFDNDGWLDIFHINGFPSYGEFQTDFRTDPSKLFLNNRDGSFREITGELELHDIDQGRGLVCFDYDLDGDIDIFTSNWEAESKLWRNDLEDNPGFLQIRLNGEPNNPSAVGALVQIRTGDLTQTREVTVASNYASQNPLIQHFGLGGAQRVDELRVRWPHGGETLLTDIEPGQVLTLKALDASPPPFSLEPGTSAAWFDPAHDGEGFMIEMLAGGRAVLYWFTYDFEGRQDWYIAIGTVQGRRILFPELLRVSGGEFGPGFDPSGISETVVGSAAFTWTGCNSGFMDWTLAAEHSKERHGRQELSRLSQVMGVDCGRPVGVAERKEAGLSGSWYDPSHAGEGYTLQVLSDGRVLVYWFSFDPQGERRWFFGVGAIENGRLVFGDMLTTQGGIFGGKFDPKQVRGLPWGRLELDIGCDGGRARYESSEAGFGSGELNLVRLSSLDGLDCVE